MYIKIPDKDIEIFFIPAENRSNGIEVTMPERGSNINCQPLNIPMLPIP